MKAFFPDFSLALLQSPFARQELEARALEARLFEATIQSRERTRRYRTLCGAHPLVVPPPLTGLCEGAVPAATELGQPRGTMAEGTPVVRSRNCVKTSKAQPMKNESVSSESGRAGKKTASSGNTGRNEEDGDAPSTTTGRRDDNEGMNMAAQVDDRSQESSTQEGMPVTAEGLPVDFINEVVTDAPMAMFASVEELSRELVCLLKGDVGVLALDRPVQRDERVVITVAVPEALEPGELVFQVRIKGVMMRDGEFGARATLCDDKSRIFIARYLKKLS